MQSELVGFAKWGQNMVVYSQRWQFRFKLLRSSKSEPSMWMIYLNFFLWLWQSSPCMASAPSGLLWLTIRLALKGQRGIAQLNKLLDLQSLEECWLTRTQLKRDWFIELECSGSPNLSISLLCIITISKQESASTNETLVVTREPKMLLVTEGSSALDAHKEKPHERSPLLHQVLDKDLEFSREGWSKQKVSGGHENCEPWLQDGTGLKRVNGQGALFLSFI